MTQAAQIRIRTFTGAAMREGLAAFQQLHVAVFYDWPYLYEGQPQSEPYISSY